MVGTAENEAMRSEAMAASTAAGSNAATVTTQPSLKNVGRLTCPRPVAWNSGAMQKAVSVPRTSACASWFMVLKVRLPWVSTAPLGRPVVPLVYKITASSSGGAISWPVARKES